MLDGFDDSYAYPAEVYQYKSKSWEVINRYKLKRDAKVDAELKITEIIKKRSKETGDDPTVTEPKASDTFDFDRVQPLNERIEKNEDIGLLKSISWVGSMFAKSSKCDLAW